MEKEINFLDLKSISQKNQLEALIVTLESDRKRVAQDLHDDISSKLNVVSLNCHLLNTPNLSQKDITEITKTIIEYTSKALESSRRITHTLLPPVLERFGLHSGIEELCMDLNNKSGVVVHYTNNLKFDFKENSNHIHIYRILQELAKNSIQHSEATSISILFDIVNDRRTCIYSDNGIGLDINELKNSKGLGMKKIASRVAILEGSVSVESSLNKGMTVVFNF
ncbi:sensor histidine kinase [Flavobacterium sp. N3904]|uniref:sensor histidine kinase n=1 Tax=Flavobacterium sp. N3904 TaxID=2986835 RepID=UPI002224CA3E|nr:ATP-binding protein [Flavobacterium sp. N3904]